MPGKRSSGGGTRVLPRPLKAPPVQPMQRYPQRSGFDPVQAATSVAKGVLGGAKQMASDALWSVTHPKERLLQQGRAQGQAVTDPRTGKTYYMNLGEVASNPGRVARAALKSRATNYMQNMAEKDVRARLTGYSGGYTFKLSPEQLDALTSGNLKLPGVKHYKIAQEDAGLIAAGGAGDSFRARTPVMLGPNREVLIGSPGTHHHQLVDAAGLRTGKGEAFPPGWVQASIWKEVDDPFAGPIPARFDVGDWAGYSTAKRQKAAVSRLLAHAAGAQPLPATSMPGVKVTFGDPAALKAQLLAKRKAKVKGGNYRLDRK